MTNHPNRSRVRDWPAYLRAFRAQHDLTQKQLADQLQIATRTVEDYEGGKRTPVPYLKRALNDLRRELSTSPTPQSQGS
jgi:transcriptional regulator with XRE-family HTH domain